MIPRRIKVSQRYLLLYVRSVHCGPVYKILNKHLSDHSVKSFRAELFSSCFNVVSHDKEIHTYKNALKVVFSLSGRYKIFTSNWLWIEICENVVLSKIDITMTIINKKFETDKSRILCDLDLLLKIQH